MYYSTNNQSVLEEHEFVIKVKHSESLRSSTINLGFMIVEGSEEIRLNGQALVNGTDYTIDYFTGTLNIINQQALDPTANLEPSPAPGPIFPITNGIIAIIVLIEVIIIGLNLKEHASLTEF